MCQQVTTLIVDATRAVIVNTKLKSEIKKIVDREAVLRSESYKIIAEIEGEYGRISFSDV